MKKICLILFAFSLVLSLVSCEKDKDVVLVVVSVSNEQVTPTYTSATISSVISSKVVISQAFVHYTTSKDFASYEEVQMQVKDGQYTAELTGLQENSTYYYRYAVANRYSSLVIETVNEFSTLNPSAPVVATLSVNEVTDTSAVVCGNVTDDGSSEVTECGVVYSTNQYPTTADSKVISGRGIGEFTCTITGLQGLTTYYVRAYAINSAGIVYGNQVSFTTLDKLNSNPYEGVGFSVSETKRVIFSSGNLQYHPKNDKWHFAENQWSYIGESNANILDGYDGWIDLFGWGTGNTPTYFIYDSNYYQTFVDWGVNKIDNETPDTWRTLSVDEWNYLLCVRVKAEILFGLGSVNDVNGLILLPDDWKTPTGLLFIASVNKGLESIAYSYEATIDNHNHFEDNIYNIEQWQEMEKSGAVFLPAAGHRYKTDVRNLGGYGDYWSCTENGPSQAYRLTFGYREIRSNDYYHRMFGRSVRLVKDL